MTTPYYQDASVTLLHGDSLEVLPTLPDASADVVITDPPYNLSASAKRDGDCLRRILLNVSLPDDEQRDGEISESGNLPRPSVGASDLRRVARAAGEESRIGVPERPVDFQYSAIAQDEVSSGHEPPVPPSDGDLPAVPDSQTIKDFGHYIFRAADGGDSTFCDGTCSCFSEPSAGVITMRVALPSTTRGDLPSYLLDARWRSDADVWLRNHPGSQSESAPPVVAGTGAVLSAMLRLDLLRRSAELFTADDTGEVGTHLQLVSAPNVGAISGAGGLATELEPPRVCVIDRVADGTFTLDLPWHSLKSSKTTGGFMGKTWDGWDSPAAFQRWCLQWSRECLRVLKPGGHMLAFGGTRTWHRLACAVEDAGFEIRDSIAWLYGSGFPKSLDVSKAIDRKRDDRADVLAITTRLADLAAAAGITRNDLDRMMGTSDMGGWWLSRLSHRCACPSVENWTRLRDIIPGAVELDAEVWRLNGRKGSPGEAWELRPITQQQKEPLRSGDTITFDQRASTARERRDIPATDAARQWQGWGTALKPAFEPIVVARKPLGAGTVAANVLAHGTGALNIDACRIAANWATDPTRRGWQGTAESPSHIGFDGISGVKNPHVAGRWPANVVLDDASAAELDGQSGETSSNARSHADTHLPKQGTAAFGDYGVAAYDREFTDQGGASRFFYTSKAGSDERITHAGTSHPTVKPLSLMRWLVRLATPPGGVILEPFAGSGTTVEAAILEGFRCIAIEREADYLPLITQRIHRRRDPVAYLTAAGDDLGLFDEEPA